MRAKICGPAFFIVDYLETDKTLRESGVVFNAKVSCTSIKTLVKWKKY
jgi:hypothetical protein